MKRLFVATFFALAVLGIGRVEAQNKIGYISLQELIPNMPEYKKAETDLGDYQKALAEQLQDYQNNFNYKDSSYRADSVKWSPVVREVKRKELNELYMKIVNYQQEAQQLLQRKEQELIAPIQQKALTTIQAVAKENGYTYIFTKEQLLTSPPGDDVLQLVAKKLGLKITSPTAALNPGGNK